MSSSVILLQLLQQNLYHYGGPILMLAGTISCTLNIIVFTQQSLRRNSCSTCLISFNVASLLSLYLSLLPAILQIGYHIEPGVHNLAYCRMRFYLGFILTCLPQSYLVLASTDRVFITSEDARKQQWSNRYFIYKCVFSITFFWIVFHTHALFYTNIIEYVPNHPLCYFTPGLYTVLVSYYTLIVNGLIPLFLYIVLGVMTLKNLHRRRHRYITSINRANAWVNINIFHRKDRQLVRMLSAEIINCMIFDFIHPGVLLYKQLTQHQVRSRELMVVEELMMSISILSVHVPLCTSFYTNLMVSKTFRREVKKIVLNKS